MQNEHTDTRPEKISEISGYFAHILRVLNPGYEKDPNLKDTPERVAKMWVNETCSSLFDDAPELTVFPNDRKVNQIVIERNITFTSMCAHHFMPFIGRCHIAYKPDKFLLGLSKFHRVVRYFSLMPQLQENLTDQICEYLCEKLKTKDVMVIMVAGHECVRCRGVEDHTSDTITSAVRGMFLESSSAKLETLQLIKL